MVAIDRGTGRNEQDRANQTQPDSSAHTRRGRHFAEETHSVPYLPLPREPLIELGCLVMLQHNTYCKK
jgi:hypothetical protein